MHNHEIERWLENNKTLCLRFLLPEYFENQWCIGFFFNLSVARAAYNNYMG
jgi:hypothetical protein